MQKYSKHEYNNCITKWRSSQQQLSKKLFFDKEQQNNLGSSYAKYQVLSQHV
jgi:hypothetical protein